jgi:hypothetical protein
MRRREHASIGARVRAVHLDHFCSGGLGLPVTTLGVAGLRPLQAAQPAPDSIGPRAVGQRCERCGQPITAGQDARRRATRHWAHETCPG